MRQLFGTDGIRAKAGDYPLDEATMIALGAALATRLRTAEHPTPRIILGMDTRESGAMIAKSLLRGIRSAGGEGVVAGVVPTPAVAYLCHSNSFDAGISISASHNPWHDNGVKIFGSDGMKLSDRIEKAIEDELLEMRGGHVDVSDEPLTTDHELVAQYERFLVNAVAPNSLAGKRVILDAGQGAAHQLAGAVFRQIGAEVEVINAEPNGRNINARCGAMHPEGLASVVVEKKADFGVAFDGDADRAIFVDDRGVIRNGDEILYLWAEHLQKRSELRNHLVVATVMSNLGFEKQLAADGIRLLRANVGDKYVLEMMIEHGAVLGGEQSGHIIDLRLHTTGDGLHTAVAMGELLAAQDRPFSALDTFTPMPQILVNEKVRSKPPLESLPTYQSAAAEAEQKLNGNGRILVRYSGTENLVRVMVEGTDDALIREVAESLRSALKADIG